MVNNISKGDTPSTEERGLQSFFHKYS